MTVQTPPMHRHGVLSHSPSVDPASRPSGTPFDWEGSALGTEGGAALAQVRRLSQQAMHQHADPILSRSRALVLDFLARFEHASPDLLRYVGLPLPT